MAAKQVPGLSRTTEEIEFQAGRQPADANVKAEAVEPEAIEPKAIRRAYPEEEMRLWKFINGVFYQLGQDCPIFGILVIGETGTGKSTLINNLLGREVAVVGHSMESETQHVTPHERSVEGVPVVVYDTPGLDDTSGDDDPKHLEIMKILLDRKKIHLVIYCIKLTENRMRRGLIRTFQEYHKIGVPWKQTVVTLTFADIIVADTTERITMMQQQLKKTLDERVGVASSVVHGLKICPTAKDPTQALPNGKLWYVPFWLDVVEVLVPAALAQFLYIHKDNIHMESMPASKHPNPLNIALVGEDQERFHREVDRLPKLLATTTTEFAASEFLKKYKTEFFEVVDPRLSLLRLVRKGVITEDVKSDINISNTKDACEVLYHHLYHHSDVYTLKEYCEVAIDAEGNLKMQLLGRKMMEDLQQGATPPTHREGAAQTGTDRAAGSETPASAHPSIGTCQTAPTSKKAQATSTATQFAASEVLKEYETEFFEVINPRFSLLRLVRKGVITEDVKSDINISHNKDACEVLYHHLYHHANLYALKEYCKVAISADGYPKMQSLGRKMMEELEQGGEQTH